MVTKFRHNNGTQVTRYPWAKWFEKAKFTLEKSRDFDCSTHGMAAMVRNRATLVRKRVSLRIVEDTIHVTVRGDIK
jgi:hypothetical protein